MSESGNCASFQFYCFHFYRVTVVRRSYLRAQLLKQQDQQNFDNAFHCYS